MALGSERVPDLSEIIGDSDIFTALFAVKSPLGVRHSGPPKSCVRDIGPRSVEFHVLYSAEDLKQEEWQLLQARFVRSAQSVGLSRQAADLLGAALNEMGENAVLHANSPVSALVGYSANQGRAEFCVADVGIGVLASLRTCSEYGGLTRDIQALRAALQNGASRFGPGEGGYGFHQVFKALSSHWGELRFRSGRGCIEMNGQNLESDIGQEYFPPALPGFQVYVACNAVT